MGCNAFLSPTQVFLVEALVRGSNQMFQLSLKISKPGNPKPPVQNAGLCLIIAIRKAFWVEYKSDKYTGTRDSIIDCNSDPFIKRMTDYPSSAITDIILAVLGGLCFSIDSINSKIQNPNTPETNQNINTSNTPEPMKIPNSAK